MTQAEAAHLAKVLDAYAKNKIIQWMDDSGNWNDCKEDEEMFFVNPPFRYRIKPEENRIPFTYDTLIKHFKEFPCTLIKDRDGWIYNILGFNKEQIRIHKISVDRSEIITYKELLKHKWLVTDKPCGILII